jgi:hypothetical protein
VRAIVCEICDGDTGEAAHGFIAEIHAAVVVACAVGVTDVEREFIGFVADSDGAFGVDGGEGLRLPREKCGGESDGESELGVQFHF